MKRLFLAASMLFVRMPAQACPPQVYSSLNGNIDRVTIAGKGAARSYWSGYSIVTPSLQPADVVLIIAQFEITNSWQFNVMVARSIARGLRSGPMSRSVSKLRLSLASPPVRWKAMGKPPKSVFK
jgi:hypothetical protein